jgi:7,8-dihydropterin-6-yl-methyl-4-(beta-D-ribofuranosyl)aminobenzene 5'-phosphate synthase
MKSDEVKLNKTELRKTDPEYIVPCHCTTNRIIQMSPEKFLQTSVETWFNFNK